MCGIAGFCGPVVDGESLGRRMAASLNHRGPDDAGVWYDSEAGVLLAHARLSILDLSQAGHQPMASASGRYRVAFNGEIYNFRQLRSTLESRGHRFRGHSDTEVLLAAVEQWGLRGALTRFVGMFAFALWDRDRRVLRLARDRLGEKPLYYGWQRGAFVFGSELKALRCHPSWDGEIDREALCLYLRHNYVPGPCSIHKGVSKLLPGHYLTLDSGGESRQDCYWSAREVVLAGIEQPFRESETDLADRLEQLLLDTIAEKMIADVPLGAFLSGGYDSSMVVAIMQAQSDRPVRTFSIGFNEEGYNEAHYAKAVANHLGTDHTELYVTGDQARQVIPRLPRLYDEPFSDSSQIPTFLVSEMTRRDVVVSLSGDGGDELFGGYTRYLMADDLWRKLERTPKVARRLAAWALLAVSPRRWDQLFRLIGPLIPARYCYKSPGDKVHKLAGLLGLARPETLYRMLISHWPRPELLVIGGHEPATVLTADSTEMPSLSEKMMYLDTLSYLPDDILVKVDRASMGVGLEARVPFLDHRIVEFAWRLPLGMKIRDREGKWLLRQVLYRYLPRELMDRPKMGFGIPLDRWLRSELREWAGDLLSVERLRRDGFFRPGPIQQLLNEHLSGERNWSYHLWDVLMFQSWLDQQRSA